LIRNDIPYRWRAKYNEDTDLSLRVLKDGSQSARISYDTFKKGKTVPLNPEIKEELKDGPGNFEPEGDLDK